MKVIRVRIIVILLLGILSNAYSQNSVPAFIGKFKQLDLPINNISDIVTYDSLDNVWLNDYLFPREGGKIISPKIINDEGCLKKHVYTSRYPEENEYFGFYGKNYSYHNRIDVIGSVFLFEKCESIIIRVESTESIFYDIWNIEKSNLKPISQICLFYGYKERWDKPTIDFVEVESEITQDGLIVWHSYQRGLHTYITWKIDEETGLFRVVSERKEGEFEY